MLDIHLSSWILERSLEDGKPDGLVKFCPLMSNENMVSYSSDSSDNDKVLDKEFSKAFPLGAKSELDASKADEPLRIEDDFATRFADC